MTTNSWPGDSPEGTFTRAFAASARDGHALAALASTSSLAGYRDSIRQRTVPQSHEAHLLRSFARVRSLDELGALDAAELLARALEAAPLGMMMVRLDKVLGHVREEKTTAYVLYRTRWRDPRETTERDMGPRPDLHSPSVATLSISEGEWRLELDMMMETGMPGFRNMHFIGEHALAPANP
jgi:hypothetical protein